MLRGLFADRAGKGQAALVAAEILQNLVKINDACCALLSGAESSPLEGLVLDGNTLSGNEYLEQVLKSCRCGGGGEGGGAGAADAARKPKAM